MKKKTINSLYVYFFGVMFIVYGCSGNEICINLIEQSIVTVEGGDIRRFEIDVNDTIYYFHLKEDIRHQNAVDLRNVGYNVEVDPSAGHTDPSNKAFFSPTDDLTILLLFS